MKFYRYLHSIFALAMGFLLVLMFFWADQTGEATAAIHYVSPDGNCGGAAPCYTNIVDALADSAPGEEIRIAEGLYTVSISITPIS